jgi:hypothetical protein
MAMSWSIPNCQDYWKFYVGALVIIAALVIIKVTLKFSDFIFWTLFAIALGLAVVYFFYAGTKFSEEEQHASASRGNYAAGEEESLIAGGEYFQRDGRSEHVV